MSAIGRLRHRLTLEQAAASPDGAGGADVAWTEVATLWAKIETLAGREGLSGEAVTAEATHRIGIRRNLVVTMAMRFTGGGRTYEIVAVAHDDERRRTRCLCRERPA